jgi:transcriptional regulator with XRE-family HTH domain
MSLLFVKVGCKIYQEAQEWKWYMEFGIKLRELREKAGLTQYELAEGIAASSFISLLEAGKRKPKPELIAKLASRNWWLTKVPRSVSSTLIQPKLP